MDIQIEKTPAYKIGDKPFTTLEDAQKFAIIKMIDATPLDGLSSASNEMIGKWLLDNSAAVVAILKSTGRKPRIRKVKKTAAKAATKPTAPKTSFDKEGRPT